VQFVTVFQLADIKNFSDSDYLAIYDLETGETNRIRVSEFLKIIQAVESVNGKTGNQIILSPDDLDDSQSLNKFVSATEKQKLNILRTDQGSNYVLCGDGNYKDIAQLAGGGAAIAVQTITERNGLSGLQDAQLVIVRDASEDPTVTSGSALYSYNAATGIFDKVSEYESLDLTIKFEDIVGEVSGNTQLVNYITTNSENADFTPADPTWFELATGVTKTSLKAGLDYIATNFTQKVKGALKDANGNYYWLPDKAASTGPYTLATTADLEGKEDKVHRGTTSPADTSVLWLDITSEPNILKRWNGTGWVNIGTTTTVTGSTINGNILVNSAEIQVYDDSGKVTANAAITGGTYPKITYDSKGLVTAGSALVKADIPALDYEPVITTLADSKLSTNVPLKNANNVYSVPQVHQTSISTEVPATSKNTVSNATGNLHEFVRGTTVVAKVTADGTVDVADFKKAGVKAFVDTSYLNPATIQGIDDIPATEKAKLDDAANWDANGVYVGTPLVNCGQGTEYYTADGNYYVRMQQDNAPRRVILG
jgi:hypothetical protein